MSYCRWSSDDFQCDVYVYADARGGWTIHVAGRRVRYTEPLPAPVDLEAPLTEEKFAAFHARHQKVMAMVDAAERVAIGLPHDGATFNDPTAGTCADRLEALAAVGYRVPAGVIDCLRAESGGAA